MTAFGPRRVRVGTGVGHRAGRGAGPGQAAERVEPEAADYRARRRDGGGRRAALHPALDRSRALAPRGAREHGGPGVAAAGAAPATASPPPAGDGGVALLGLR